MGGHVCRWYLWGSYMCKQEDNTGCQFLGNVHLKKKGISPSPQTRLASSRDQRTCLIGPPDTHVTMPSLGFDSVSVSSGDGIAVLRLTRPSLYREPSPPSWRLSSHLDLFESTFNCRNQVIQKRFMYASRIIKGGRVMGIAGRGEFRWRLSWSFPVPKDIKEEDRERSHQRSRRCFVPWPSPAWVCWNRWSTGLESEGCFHRGDPQTRKNSHPIIALTLWLHLHIMSSQRREGSQETRQAGLPEIKGYAAYASGYRKCLR